MAALVGGSVPQQPFYNGVDEEILTSIKELIMHRTGCPPVNADHLYTFKQHMDNFPHPCPTVANSIAGGTFPTPSPPQPISQNLHGWADVNPQNQASVQAIFNHFSQEDQQHAYNHFFQKLHRAPKVLEFSRFLLIYEGNDLTDTSHKTLGQLYLENEEFRETLNRHLRSIGLLEQMLSSKDVMIQVLGQSSTANIRKINDLQTQKLNLQRILCKVQQDKAQLQLDHNSLQQEHTQCLTELEDERKDKQVSQHRCQQLQTDNQALQNEITRQTETITDMQVTIHEHEQNTDRLTDMVRDLKQKCHRECREKTDIYNQLMQKSEMISELEDDRALYMMENEAQGKYFLDMKEERMKLQRENKELKESVDMCKNIIKAQYDKLISTIEISLSRLEENLALMKEKNFELSKAVTDLEIKTSKQSATIFDLQSKTTNQSITISDLETKNSDLETKNSDLETKTTEQSITISDLETKNSDLETKTTEQSITISDLETKNSDLETKNSDLETKNSDLETKTTEQSFTISGLENKNSDLETKTTEQSITISDLETKNSDLETKNSDLETKNSDLETKTTEQSITISDLETKNSDLETKNSDLETKNSDLETKTTEQSITISELKIKATRQSNTVSDLENRTTELQLQTQRQQLIILFLIALIFTLICLQFTSPGSNAFSTS